jgi:chorismate synthase
VTVELRELRTAGELALLPSFEEKIWGGGAQGVATHMLVATVGEGGMAIGAFDGERLVGAVYGFSTHEPHVLHSHYMAVDPDYRRQGLAVRLKRAQRDWCLAHGRTAIRWTFDPLQLANAHLNLNVLGALGEAYHVDLYGPMSGINGGLPSDRLTVRWDLAASPHAAGETCVVRVLRVTAEQIARGHDDAVAARLALRSELQPLLAGGWRVAAVDRASAAYTLIR